VTALRSGLGRKRETLKFVVAGDDQSTGTAHPDRQARLLNIKGAKSFYVEVDTLDNQIEVNNLPRPDFIKIDVEGLELDVLNGMTQTISEYKPKLLIELHGQSEREIGEFLIFYNYNINQIEASINITSENINLVRGHLYCT
jgi:FkbM family methyltransferase